MVDKYFNKFPSLSNLPNVVKNIQRLNRMDDFHYRAKIKLHGTNAGVTITKDGEVYAQKRTSCITPEKDNFGFARFVEDNKEEFKKICGGNTSDLTVYGEWAGKGVQKNIALTKLDEKHFFVFAVAEGEILVTCPTFIEVMLDKVNIPNMKVLPWFNDKVYTVNFFDKTKLQPCVDEWNKLVTEIDECDPYIKEEFGIEGYGEGLVLYPVTDDIHTISIHRDLFSLAAIKVKGEKHDVVKTKVPATIEPEMAKGINDFVERVVTENRLMQGYTELEIDKAENPFKLIGNFIGWVSIDVYKECEAEMETNGLEWKHVNKFVSKRTRVWLMNKLNDI